MSVSGRMMGVRADMTPQVSRIDAHHLRCDRPVRLCYLGTVLRATGDARSGSRSGGCGAMLMALRLRLLRSLAGQASTQSVQPVQASGSHSGCEKRIPVMSRKSAEVAGMSEQADWKYAEGFRQHSFDTEQQRSFGSPVTA